MVVVRIICHFGGMPTGHADSCAPSIRMAAPSARAPPARFATAKFSVIVIIIIVKIILNVLFLIVIVIMFIHFGISIIFLWLIVVAYVFRHILHNPSVIAIHITTRNLLISAAVRGPKR